MPHDVFSRIDHDQPIVSPSRYNFTIGVVLLWGFLFNYLLVRFADARWIASVDFRLFLLGYFASCFLGIWIFTKSTHPLVSFLGYNLVVIPFGLVVDVVVSKYDPNIVLNAISVTGAVTAMMMVIGMAYPRVFEKTINIVSIILISTIVCELIAIWFFGADPGIVDWIVAICFCWYIGYDWARANKIPKTLDNAVDSAASIYMDVVNLFLRILKIMGRKK